MKKVEWRPEGFSYKDYRLRKRLSDLKFIEVTRSPWSYFGTDAVLVARDLMHTWVPQILKSLTPSQRSRVLSGRPTDIGMGKKVFLYRYFVQGVLLGGYITLEWSGKRITVYDSYGFLGKRDTSNDLAATYAEVVSDLYWSGKEVGLDLLPRHGSANFKWHNVRACIPNLLSVQDVLAVPLVTTEPFAEGPSIDCVAFGHSDDTYWLQDITNAYASAAIRLFPELRDLFERLIRARELCETDVARRLVKVIMTSIIGKMKGNGLCSRPDIAMRIYGEVRSELGRAMNLVEQPIRWHTDGFISSEYLRIESDNFVWKDPQRLSGLTILAVNTWWSPEKSCDGLVVRLGLKEYDVIEHFRTSFDKPYAAERILFDWRTLEPYSEPYLFNFVHSRSVCTACRHHLGSPDKVFHANMKPERYYNGFDE